MTLDDDFPLGEGTADTETEVSCPYCGESVTMSVDPGSGPSQEYVEDCPVCCQAWRVLVGFDDAGQASVSLSPIDE